MQLCISNHSRSNFYRFLNPISHIVDKEPKTVAGIGIACLYNHAPHSNHSDVWFVKVVSTLCSQSSTTSLSGFHSDYLRNHLSPSIAFEVIRRLNGYHCNGKLAFDFFQFTRLNLNVTHSIATYNVLLRSLCQMGFHDLAKLVYEYMRVDGHWPDSSVLGLLVSSFAHAGNFDFAKQLLSHAQSDNVEIRSFVYNNFLTLLVRRNRVQEAVSFFSGHISKSQCYCPDTCTFNIVIRGLCRVGGVEKAFELFNDMGSFGCSPDVVTYNALINGLSRVGEADRGLELLREVQSGNVFSPDVVTYTSVISGYCKLGNMEMASSIYDEMISSGVKPSLITFNVLIDGFGKSGDMSSAHSTYEKMLCCGCLPDVVTFTSLIDGYCRSGKVDQGLRLWDEMNERNLAPNVYTFAILINSLCKENRINEARDLLRQLRRREDIVPKPFIYNPVIDGLCKAGNVVEANVVVAEMEAKKCNPDKLTYTILIIGHCMKGKMSEAMTIFTKMLEVGCAPDRITVNSFISCLLKAGMPKEAYRIKQAAWEGLNLEMSSLRISNPIRTNMDIPVAA
ncbi:pentatricopeptide repeat-containing protein At2g06000-like [Rhododendron vialii]|uniref:pentatricopeptide repeat-containing protein At2g06000-like n=1 Tax=Rhododendron vialii TaxID=182163 RepID=UPI00265F98A5|nr:pentatricopeptide repeat-containing protein At2g06000-like [Rhododendron vialii]XP_058194304.1 pentatricopeptide repeat-containing protein At2g06000-like [Rhododendron vialii]